MRGHAAGGEVLEETGKRLKAMVRAGDTAARLGGDEFVILLPDLGGTHSLTAVAARVRDAVRRPIAIGPLQVRVDASIGTLYRQTPAQTAQELLAVADAAMYADKRARKASLAAAGR